MSTESLDYLQPNEFFDYQSNEVQLLARELLPETDYSPIETAVRLYLGVRDRFRYNPYRFNLTAEQFRASHCARQQESYCIPKAVLLGALCRSQGIPARLGLADVKNHLTSRRLLDLLRTDVFVMHGYTELYLEGKWVKATPAFDKHLCHYMGIEPLAFDGIHDSVFQPFNLDGSRNMEYLKTHGSFVDVPVQQIIDAVMSAYPHLKEQFGPGKNLGQSSLENDLLA